MKNQFSKISSFFKNLSMDKHTLLLLAIFLIVTTFFSITNADKGFINNRSVTSMGVQLSEIGILALAMMVTVLIGGINLSINATANLGAVLSGYFLFLMFPPPDTGGPTAIFTQINMPENPNTIILVIAFLIPLLVGLLTGILNGILVGYIGIPPILATLATMSLFTGISAGLTTGRTITGFPEQFSFIANEKLLGIPVPFLLFVILTIIAWAIISHTTFGFKLRMLGTNENAAEFSGINNKSIILRAYIISGLYSSIAGIIVLSRTMSAAYEYGATTYVLLTILIGVLAGVISGFGSVINVFISMLILQVLSTGFQMMLQGVRGSTFFKDFSWGVLLIVIFLINYLVRKEKKVGAKRKRLTIEE